jgi:putative hemolysin
MHTALAMEPKQMMTTIPSSLFEIRAGDFAVKMAEDAALIRAAQQLRYKIFYEEMGGTPPAEVARQKRDFDEFDQHFDHLLVMDYSLPDGPQQVVGTYRMMRRDAMKAIGRFYSESEFDITPIKHFSGEILELGRSCVHPDYRSRAVMQLLWRGIGAYAAHYQIGLMFGCASFPGANPAEHIKGLSYLNHFHLAPIELRTHALHSLRANIDLLPEHQIDVRETFAALPTLIKGYIRLGGYIGEGAIIDRQCNTTDVCVIVRTDMITEKYLHRYQPDGGK